jgi:hypothetical protein
VKIGKKSSFRNFLFFDDYEKMHKFINLVILSMIYHHQNFLIVQIFSFITLGVKHCTFFAGGPY